MPGSNNDRCSFEVIYRKNADGVDDIEHVVVRTGLSDAAVTLTIPQVVNLARLLDIVQKVSERMPSERGNVNGQGVQALPRAQVMHGD